MFDLRTTLRVPLVYRAFQNLVVAPRKRSLFVDEYVRPLSGHRILDIGCGPADILAHLPPCDYIGVDLSPRYIQSARARFGTQGTFHCLPVRELTVQNPASFDIVLAKGVIHHLDDDETRGLFAVAHAALKPSGRFVSVDPCYVPDQSILTRCLLGMDRGKFVRTQLDYLELVPHTFADVRSTIRHDLNRIPYTHVILECSR